MLSKKGAVQEGEFQIVAGHKSNTITVVVNGTEFSTKMLL